MIFDPEHQKKRQTFRVSGVLLTTVGVFFWVTPASGATPQCFGRDATIVGSGLIVGTEGDDVIVGRGGSDKIKGLGGDDRMCGGEGYDELLGGDGNDKLQGNAKTDTLDGGPGNDVLRGGRKWDFLEGGEGDDILGGPRFNWHDSAVYRNASGPVTIDLVEGTATGQGADTLARGINFLQLSAHDDVVIGSQADDNIRDFGGSDQLDLLGGNDYVYPPDADQDGNDTFDLGPGHDFASSGFGNDFIDGGEGNDTVGGGDGIDQCPNVENPGSCEA